MSLQLAPLTEADLPAVARIHQLAFLNSPIHGRMFPPGVDYYDFVFKRHSRSFHDDPSATLMKIIDTDTNELVSFTKWVNCGGPERGGGSDPKVRLEMPSEFPEGSNVELCTEFYGGMKKASADLLKDRPHLLCTILATHPNHERRGAASRLLDWGIEDANRLGIPAYLESTPEGLRLYKSRGFEEKGEFSVDLTKGGGDGIYRLSLMLRPVPGDV